MLLATARCSHLATSPARLLVPPGCPQHFPVQCHQQLCWGCAPLQHPGHWQNCLNKTDPKAGPWGQRSWPATGRCSPIADGPQSFTTEPVHHPVQHRPICHTVGQSVKDAIRDNNKGLTEIQRNCIHCLPFIHQIGDLVMEGDQITKAGLPLRECLQTVPDISFVL